MKTLIPMRKITKFQGLFTKFMSDEDKCIKIIGQCKITENIIFDSYLGILNFSTNESG